MTDALIFDIDGTLLDSVDLHAEAWGETFRHFGYDIPVQKIRSQIGKGGDQLLPALLGKQETDKNGKQLEEFRSELFKKKYLPRVKAFAGVRPLFKKALERRKKLALASSAKGDELKRYEEIAGIDDLVEVETSSADAEKSKPHPDILEAALARLGKGIDPERVIVIGDSPYDAEAGKRSGLKVVGVRCGGFAEQELRAAGCIAIYDGPEDLCARFDTSPLA
ncbi:MAG TPA: HAD family hydrolase [Bryobacteraceae bacterium]|nr:HAD family hydrolase [Bryobacteraceae bacterium]